MKVKTNEKQIQKLKTKFPQLKITRINEYSWEIEKPVMSEQEENEIMCFFKENETKIIEKKEVVMSENKPIENPIAKPIENPIAKPISEITGNLSQAFSSLSSVIMGQASAQVAEIERKIVLLDNKIKESNQLLSSERVKMVEEQKVIVTKHVENLQKITNDLTTQVNSACQTVEKHILELTAKFDEKNRDFSAAIETQKNKMAKLSVSVADALKD